MLRKLIGTGLTVLALGCALGCAMFFVFAVGDLITGGSPETSVGVLAGLAVFFGGLAVTTGFGAWRMLTTKGVSSRSSLAQGTSSADRTVSVGGIDIALEGRILAHAAKHEGRVTVAEVAVACAVSLEQAERALDQLALRGHANLQVTPNGDSVYVLHGFLSAEQKQQAEDVVEATRSL